MVFHGSRLVFHGSRSVFHGSWLAFHGSRLVYHGFSWFQDRFSRFQVGFHSFSPKLPARTALFFRLKSLPIMFLHGFHGSRLVYHGFWLVYMVLLVETTTKLYPGPMIQSRPCRPKAGFGLVIKKYCPCKKNDKYEV